MSGYRSRPSMVSLIRTLAGTLVVLLPACSGSTQPQQVKGVNTTPRPQATQQQAPDRAQQRFVIEGDATSVITAVGAETGEVVLSRVGERGPPDEEQLAKARLEHGKFRMEGTVDWIGMANLSVIAAADSTGYDPGALFASAEIVLEPGTTRVVLREGAASIVQGGKYSQALIEPLLNNPAYAVASQKGFQTIDGNVSEAKQKKQIAEMLSYRAKADKIRTAHLSPLLQSPDPLLRFLAMGNATSQAMWKPSDLEQLISLQKELPGYAGVARAINGIHGEQQLVATAAAIAPGKTISDFTAPEIGGRAFHLSEVFKQHRYVLVDFWASWCGPCREEIPHMKKAYQVFHPKGFEIVSFSLDDKDKAWRRASDEEKLPWINTSDLQAFSSPVSQLFGLRTIPANFLVDDKGTIVAMSLRGKDLEKKLTALLGT